MKYIILIAILGLSQGQEQNLTSVVNATKLTEDQIILDLLESNAKTLNTSILLLDNISKFNVEIGNNITNQSKTLSQLDNSFLLLNKSFELNYEELAKASNLYVNNTQIVDSFLYLEQLQNETKQEVQQLDKLLSSIQTKLLHDIKDIDGKVLVLTNILDKYVLSKLKNLNGSFNSFEKLQLETENQLQNVSLVNAANRETIKQLNTLEKELYKISYTQNENLDKLSTAVKNWSGQLRFESVRGAGLSRADKIIVAK
ncbi:uncharacterized protein Dwil_GK11559 [Drosophila willistoni]|uniref:Uncharacterized protein n=1 Tax=Drosophila willistoni TaxID=7260 RepID=B4N8X9_DROWI|nr:uncharacterized protein Dwil_GK11559 [Drosophila willistoni]